MSVQIRNYRSDDLELLVVLLNSVEAVDRADEGTSLEEQREQLEFPGLNPAANVFVAEDENGRLVAAGNLRLFRGDETGFRSWFTVHPAFRGRGLEDRMLARLLDRARERLVEIESGPVYFACGGHSTYPERLRAIERAGMKEIRRFWVMVQRDLQSVPEPRFPGGILARSLRPGEDDAEARDALNDSFSEHFGHVDEGVDEFHHYLTSVAYRPDLTVLAVDPGTERVAGFCHIAINEGECERLGRRRGWIDILGVRREYRRQGLGEALIAQGMRNLRAAGMDEAALGCDSENTTNATRLYFRTGFKVNKTNLVYEKSIRAAEPVKEELAASAAA